MYCMPQAKIKFSDDMAPKKFFALKTPMLLSGNLKPDRKMWKAYFEKDVKPSHVLTDALFNP